MEKIKIENFLKDYPERNFPEYKHLDAKKSFKIKKYFYRKLNVDNGLSLVKKINELSIIDNIIKSNCETLNIKQGLLSKGIHYGNNVYINWSRFDDIYQFRIDDLEKYFDYLWYESADDIDIFDCSLSWIVSITDYGTVTFLRL